MFSSRCVRYLHVEESKHCVLASYVEREIFKTHLEANVNALHPVQNRGPRCTSAALRLNCASQKQTPAMKINTQYSFVPCVFTEWCLKGSLKGQVTWSWSGKKCVGIAATITRLSVFFQLKHINTWQLNCTWCSHSSGHFLYITKSNSQYVYLFFF